MVKMVGQLVRSPTGTRKAAFFDADNTLIKGSSKQAALRPALKRGLVGPGFVAEWTIRALIFKFYGETKGSADLIREALLAAIVDVDKTELDELATYVNAELLGRVHEPMARLVKKHMAMGFDTWIISASPEEIIVPLAEDLGMTGGIGTRAEVVDGKYTGGLVGEFCYADGKAAWIEQIAAERGYDLDQCFAYSDSVSDLPMLRSVGWPFVVNPDGKLRAIATTESWGEIPSVERNATYKWAGYLLSSLAIAGGAYAAGHHGGVKAALHAVRPGKRPIAA